MVTIIMNLVDWVYSRYDRY